MNNIVNKDIQLPVVGFDGKELPQNHSRFRNLSASKPHMPSVHLAVKVDLANRRQATAKTKKEAKSPAVVKSHGDKKVQAVQELVLPCSPLWRHGGIVFGPTGTQNFKLKMNKLFTTKLFSLFYLDKVANNNLIVLDNEDFAKVSTKEGVNFLKSLDVLGKKTLVVLDTYAANLVFKYQKYQ